MTRQLCFSSYLAALLLWTAPIAAAEPAASHSEIGLEAESGEPRIVPNPVICPRGDLEMTFDQIPSQSRIRLYTLDGHLLRELHASESGAAVWDLLTSTGQPVGTGVYLALFTSDGERRAAKIAVQR